MSHTIKVAEDATKQSRRICRGLGKHRLTKDKIVSSTLLQSKTEPSKLAIWKQLQKLDAMTNPDHYDIRSNINAYEHMLAEDEQMFEDLTNHLGMLTHDETYKC